MSYYLRTIDKSYLNLKYFNNDMPILYPFDDLTPFPNHREFYDDLIIITNNFRANPHEFIKDWKYFFCIIGELRTINKYYKTAFPMLFDVIYPEIAKLYKLTTNCNVRHITVLITEFLKYNASDKFDPWLGELLPVVFSKIGCSHVCKQISDLFKQLYSGPMIYYEVVNYCMLLLRSDKKVSEFAYELVRAIIAYHAADELHVMIDWNQFIIEVCQNYISGNIDAIEYTIQLIRGVDLKLGKDYLLTKLGDPLLEKYRVLLEDTITEINHIQLEEGTNQSENGLEEIGFS
jgi:hypothetical protein